MDSKDTASKEASQKAQLAQTNKALGVFLLFFSGVIIIAVFFTETAAGKLTNLVAGLILASIGGILMLRSRKAKAAS